MRSKKFLSVPTSFYGFTAITQNAIIGFIGLYSTLTWRNPASVSLSAVSRATHHVRDVYLADEPMQGEGGPQRAPFAGQRSRPKADFITTKRE